MRIISYLDDSNINIEQNYIHLTKRACSRVWPPCSKPVSNSPLVASTTKSATSACVAPNFKKIIINYVKMRHLFASNKWQQT